MYTPCAVSFTDVIIRLERYLKRHLPEYDIQVAYVFGSDNAFFSRAFCKQGMSVCVMRPGYEEKHLLAKQEALNMPNQHHVFFSDETDSDQISLYLSSQLIRKGAVSTITEIGKQLEAYSASASHKITHEKAYYSVRDDLLWAVQKWQEFTTESQLPESIKCFRDGFEEALKNAFKQSSDGHYPKEVEIFFAQISEQDRILENLRKESPVINLDIVTSGEKDITLGVSRLFTLCDFQQKDLGIVKRPESPDFQSSLEKIRPGSYFLIDDDIATGSTMVTIEGLLPEDVRIISKISLANLVISAEKQISKEMILWDILDIRDFLIGSEASGLVVEGFHKEIYRAPYILPYVSLSKRASIPPESQLNFTLEILQLNKIFFESFNQQVCLCHTNPSYRRLMHDSHFPDDTSMIHIIDYYLEKFRINK